MFKNNTPMSDNEIGSKNKIKTERWLQKTDKHENHKTPE